MGLSDLPIMGCTAHCTACFQRGHTSPELREELPEPAGVALVADAPLEHVFRHGQLLGVEMADLGGHGN